MKDYKYKIRASKTYDLISSCFTKVRNKLEWTEKKDDDYNDSFKKIAIEIRNKTDFGYESLPVITQDLDNGIYGEEQAIRDYDKYFASDYFTEYYKRDRSKPYEVSDDLSTGTRDFGNDKKTIDCKLSTCKNTFDHKCHTDLDLDNIFQLNNYRRLYKTPEIEIFYYLAPKSFLEIERQVSRERNRIFNLDKEDTYFDDLAEKLEKMYSYDNVFSGYELKDRIYTREVPIIQDFDYMLLESVAKMNRYIENYILN